MFAGSCIGVICLVISLEFLRRGQREYEALLRRLDQKNATRSLSDQGSQQNSESGEDGNGKYTAVNVQSRAVPTGGQPPSKAVLLQRQIIRSLLHMVQFGVAYFIMLLAMYYNGQYLTSKMGTELMFMKQATSSFAFSSEHSWVPLSLAGINCLTHRRNLRLRTSLAAAVDEVARIGRALFFISGNCSDSWCCCLLAEVRNDAVIIPQIFP